MNSTILLQQSQKEELQSKSALYDINFDKEISQFTHKSTQKLELIQYQYHYACLHPILEDVAIVLRSNFYPLNTEVIDLIEPPDDIEYGEEVLEGAGNQSIQQEDKNKKPQQQLPGKRMEFGCLFTYDFNAEAERKKKKKKEENQNLKALAVKKNASSSRPQSRLQLQGQRVKGGVGGGATTGFVDVSVNETMDQGKKNQAGNQRTLFQDSIEYEIDKQQDYYRQPRYSIMFYNLNEGNNPIPIQEYAFHGYPVGWQLYVSHCGNFLYFFQQEQSNRDFRDLSEAKWCVILDIKTLEEKQILTFKDSISIGDSKMFGKGQNLYIRTERNEHLFFETESMRNLWVSKDEEIDNKNIQALYTQYITKENQAQILGQDNQDEINWCIFEVCFKETDPESAFLFCYKEDQSLSDKYIFKAKIGQDLQDVFTKNNKIWSCPCEELPLVLGLYYNANHSQFVFFDDNSIKYFYLQAGGGPDNTKLKTVKSIEPITNKMCCKNAFLYQDIMIQYNIQLMGVIFSIKEKQVGEVKKWISIESYDVKQNQKGDVTVIGTRDRSMLVNDQQCVSEIQVRFFQKQNNQGKKDQKGKDQEHVASKGNSGKIQDLIAFVDFNSRSSNLLFFDEQYSVSEHQTISFLTYKNSKVFLNFLQFDSFNEDANIIHLQTINNFEIRGEKYDDLIRSSLFFNSVIEQGRNYGKITDYILAYQILDTLYIRSLTQDYSNFFPNTFRNTPYLHKFQYVDTDDEILFLQKDSLSILIKTIKFLKDKNEYEIKKVFDFKSEYPRMFQLHQGEYFIMKDDFEILKLSREQNKFIEKKKICPRKIDIDMDLIESRYHSLDDGMFEISGNCLYWLNKLYTLYDVYDQNNDINFFEKRELFQHNGFMYGPKKLHNPSYNVYVTKNFRIEGTKGLDEADMKSPSSMQNEERKVIDNQSPTLKDVNSNMSEKRLLDEEQSQNQSTPGPGLLNLIQMRISSSKQQSAVGIMRKKSGRGRKIFEYEDNQLSSDFMKLEVIFMVPADQNYIQFLYQKTTNSQPSSYPQIQFSTFLEDNSILIMIANRLMIFNKYGQFQQNVDIEKNGNNQGYKQLQESHRQWLDEQEELERIKLEAEEKENEPITKDLSKKPSLFIEKSQNQKKSKQPTENKTKDVIFEDEQEDRKEEEEGKKEEQNKKSEQVDEDFSEDFLQFQEPQIDQDFRGNLIYQISNNTRFFVLKNKDRADLYELKKIDILGKLKYVFSYIQSFNGQTFFEETIDFNSYSVTDTGEVYMLQAFKLEQGSEQKIPCFKILKNGSDFRADVQSTILTNWVNTRDFYTNIDPNLDVTQDYYLFSNQLKSIIVNDYLFICRKQEIEYVKLFNNPSQRLTTTKLSLTLDPNKSIQKIFQTGRPDLFTIVMQDDSDDQKLLIVLTWNVISNMEYSCTVVYDQYLVGPARVVKGLNSKMNYFCTESSFYDFQFYFPLKFLKSKADKFSFPNRMDKELYYRSKHYNQKNISRDCSQYLDICNQSTIINSFTLHNLFYFQQLFQLRQSQISEANIFMDNFAARIHDLTIFHSKQDLKMLEILLKQAQYYADNPDSDGIPMKQDIYLNILYPNNDKITAFDISMDIKNPMIVEVFLKVLILLNASKEYRFSKFIRKHFYDIFPMDIKAFYKYLDTCTFQHQDYQTSLQLDWPYEEEEQYFQIHSSLLTPDLKALVQNKKTAEQQKIEEEERKKQEEIKKDQNKIMKGFGGLKDKIDNIKENEKSKDEQKKKGLNYIKQLRSQVNFMQLYEVENEQETLEQAEVSNVIIDLLEFDWVFKGNVAEKFIEFLAFTDNDELFSIYAIKVLVNFLWKSFYDRIRYRILFPFVVYFLVYLVYVTYVFQVSRLNPDDDNYKKADIAFIVLSFIGIGYQIAVEFLYMKRIKVQYFLMFWNILSLVSIIMNIAFLICDILKVSTEVMQPLGSTTVFIIWIKLFSFLKIYTSTGGFLRLVIECFKNLTYLAIAFMIGVLAFSNSFYLLSLNSTKAASYDEATNFFDSPYHLKFTNHSLAAYYFRAMQYGFETAIGGGSTDSYDSTFASQFIWLMWFLEVIFMNIILLSQLISTMNNTFEEMQEVEEQTKLKELCYLMYNYEFVIDRTKQFKRAKYVIIAKLEKGSEKLLGDEAALNDLATNSKNYFQLIQREDKQAKSMIKSDFMQGLQECQELITDGSKELNKKLEKLKAVLSRKR